MKIIRCPKMNDMWVTLKYPWKDPDFIDFAQHIDPSLCPVGAKLDAAFGDRLIWWNVGYNVAKYYDFNCRLQFCYQDLPECEILRFPNTEIVSRDEFFDGINDFKYISDEVHHDIVRSRYLPKFPVELKWAPSEPPCNSILPAHHIQLEGTGYVDEDYAKIEFVHPELEQRLSEYFSQFNVVHVRRWTGIRYYDECDFDELGEEKKKTYMENAPDLERIGRDEQPVPWMYFKDSHYFNALKDVEGPIYLATDLPCKYYMDAWYEEYGERLYYQDVIDRDIKNMFADYYSHDWMKQHGYSHQGLVDRLVDYFAVVFAGHLHVVASTKYEVLSSFAETAKLLRNVPSTIYEVEL